MNERWHNQYAGDAHAALQAGQIHGGVHLHGAHPGDDRRQPRARARLAWAADSLADFLLDRAARTVRDRGLLPEPIPLRWSWHRRPLTSAHAPAPFAPLPGVAPPGAAATAGGGIDDLLGVIGTSRTGRTVVLGDAGSGKSDSAAWTVFQALRTRAARGDEERERFPVPVLLSVTGWHHRRQYLDDWLEGELESRYRFLRRRRFGPRAVRQLLRGDRVLVFLDGFDEMAAELRAAALEQIDRRMPCRVVILSRTEEFDAVSAGRLRGAEILRLSPVVPADAAEYLRHCHGDPVPEPWQRLLGHLTEQPAGLLARALDSPLMLSLVRDAFPRPADVEVLLGGRLTTEDEIRAYLLDRLVEVAYQPESGPSLVRYGPADARRWLGYLATEMARRGIYSIDWRTLPRWAPAWPRVLAAALLLSLLGAIGGALLYGPGRYFDNFANDETSGLRFGALVGLVLGAAAGLTAELRHTTWDRAGWSLSRRLRRPRINLGACLVVGIMIGWSAQWALTGLLEVRGLAVLGSVLVGAGAGVATGVAAARPHPSPGRTRLARWRLWYSRAPLLPGAAIGGVPFTLQYAYPAGLFDEPLRLDEGLLNGAWGTFLVAFAIGAVRPVAQAHIITGRDADWRLELRRAIVAGSLFGLTMGAGFGLRQIFMWNAPGTGPQWGADVLPGLVQFLAIGVPFSVGCVIATCDSWRSILFFGQLRLRRDFPSYGMLFIEESYERRILRAEGPRFQFRHALLQDQLSAAPRVA
ncbi:hypothetical protein RM844_20925 [Streptomyces sp. DSM 44915]|uniref:NACHT domain-containing protein n=1 Tax=Streptomyces chisholmiae TaxID=3075540 RepID=A0ABU2JUV4_9ACTN|nr:NACHT domain-containing protein [Streptomyces sp. DSM 44915]MDT0268754.1 hypothetical protein [Streptomyces sp. DSM 44915]